MLVPKRSSGHLCPTAALPCSSFPATFLFQDGRERGGAVGSCGWGHLKAEYFTYFWMQQVLRECASLFLRERRVHPARSSWCCSRDSSRCSLMEIVRMVTPDRNHRVLFLPTGSEITAQRQIPGLLWIGAKECSCSPAQPWLRLGVNDQPVPFLGTCSGAEHGTLMWGC